MSKILSRILRRKLDDILEELESVPDVQLTFEHLDVLEKRFFSVHENMAFMLEQAHLHLRPVAALQLSRGLAHELRDQFSGLCIEQEPEFSDTLINVLEMRFQHLQHVFDDLLEQYASHTSILQGDRL